MVSWPACASCNVLSRIWIRLTTWPVIGHWFECDPPPPEHSSLGAHSPTASLPGRGREPSFPLKFLLFFLFFLFLRSIFLLFSSRVPRLTLPARSPRIAWVLLVPGSLDTIMRSPCHRSSRSKSSFLLVIFFVYFSCGWVDVYLISSMDFIQMDLRRGSKCSSLWSI